FLVLLVDFGQRGLTVRQEPALATTIFSCLWDCLRDTDFVGWYRENRAVGAVLTQHATSPATDVSHEIVDRVSEALRRDLPAEVVSTLEVRVYRVRRGRKE